MPPPIARTKIAESWGKAAVEATIRAWYCFMALESNEMKEVKQDWEARFAALPANDDASQIDPRLRLEWKALPVATILGGGVRPENETIARGCERFGAVTDALENAPVNPLTGHGRTPAEVNKELRAWHAYMRAEYQSKNPIFQGDYLFVQLPGASACPVPNLPNPSPHCVCPSAHDPYK